MVAYFVGQIIFGFVFHALVTTKYPECLAPTDNSKAIMEEGAACRISLGPICMQSLGLVSNNTYATLVFSFLFSLWLSGLKIFLKRSKH